MIENASVKSLPATQKSKWIFIKWRDNPVMQNAKFVDRHTSSNSFNVLLRTVRNKNSHKDLTSDIQFVEN